VGAFVNAGAVAKKSLEIASKNSVGISFVLAGQENHFVLEDFICAGGIIDRLPKRAIEFSDKAIGALLAYDGAKRSLQENIRKTKHAQELLKIGFGKDIEFACQIDIYSIVPCYKIGVTQI
jgi:phosphosulfolactate phosphohydrolase-like enzyme